MIWKFTLYLIGLAWLAMEIRELLELLKPDQPPPARPMRVEGIDISSEEVWAIMRNWECPNPRANFRHRQEKFAQQFRIIPADLNSRYEQEDAYAREVAAARAFRGAFSARIDELCMNANGRAHVKRAA